MKTFKQIFKGHIVECRDLDSLDKFCVEVLINDSDQFKDKVMQAAEDCAAKHELVTLSGNSFEFEYIQPSGKVMVKTTTREVTAETDEESKELLKNSYKMG